MLSLSSNQENYMKNMNLRFVTLLSLVGISILLMGCSSESSSNSIHDAAWAGNVDEVRKNLEAGADVNVKRDQTTVCHIAALIKNKELMKLLIASGADLNATDKNGAMPIHVAIPMGDMEMVELLLKEKIQINHQIEFGKYKGMTALNMAYEFKQSEIAELLQQNGAKKGEEL